MSVSFLLLLDMTEIKVEINRFLSHKASRRPGQIAGLFFWFTSEGT